MFYFFKQLSLRAIIWNIQGHEEDYIIRTCRRSIMKLVILCIMLLVLGTLATDLIARENGSNECYASKNENEQIHAHLCWIIVNCTFSVIISVYKVVMLLLMYNM
eukprot:UN23208